MRKNWNKKKLVIAKIYKRCNLTTTGETKAGEKSKEEELENIVYKIKKKAKKHANKTTITAIAIAITITIIITTISTGEKTKNKRSKYDFTQANDIIYNSSAHYHGN